MGHLSTFERVDASKVIPNGTNGCIKKNTDTEIRTGSCTSNNGGVGLFSDVENNTTDSNNNSDEKLKSLTNMGNGINGINNINEFTEDQRNKTDLNIYTNEFKGHTVLGIHFLAPLKWDKIFVISLLHVVFLYGFYSYETEKHDIRTSLWAFVTGGIAGLGVTGGAHRLWTHKTYKANAPLRFILMCCYCMAGQNTLFDWVRDHRVHHKYSETDADPHNSNRGFFFAHVGWLMMHKHPDVIKRGRQIDMSDVLNDPVIQFHQKYFIPLKLLLCFILPTLVPVYLWNETWYYSALQQCIFRYVFSLNFTWSVNSAAHMWGYRPYDRKINPSENRIVSVISLGEGWHNYHHVFPWDYKAAELGNYKMNLTTFWLDFFAKIGWAWDMKQPSAELVRKTIERSGDGTHPKHGHHHHIEEVPVPEDNDHANLIIFNKKSE